MYVYGCSAWVCICVQCVCMTLTEAKRGVVSDPLEQLLVDGCDLPQGSQKLNPGTWEEQTIALKGWAIPPCSSILFFIYLLIVYVYRYTNATECMWKSADNVQELILSFHYLGSVGSTSSCQTLAASTFTCWTISLVPIAKISINHIAFIIDKLFISTLILKIEDSQLCL